MVLATATAGKRTGRLTLAPVPVDAAPSRDVLLAVLQRLQFVAQPLADGQFQVGEGFLQQISFMGCSPHIQLAPPADGSSFCHIRIEGPLDQAQLRLGENAQAPRCPVCRARLSDWREQVAQWCSAPLLPQVECAKCGASSRPVDLAWRHSAGAGRMFIHVEDVFPSEAVPVAGLLKHLEAATGVAWDYFYTRD